MALINLHTHHFTNSDHVLEVVNQYPHEFDSAIPAFSIGIHPWHIDENRIDEHLEVIEAKLQLPGCVAIGECGLDKRIEAPLSLQTEVFERQLTLAKKYSKPVIIHCVAAFQELMELTEKMNPEVPLVIHGFSKKLQLANDLLERGFYLSFGKYLLRNPELQSVFEAIPNDRFFLETDSVEEGINAVYALAARYKKVEIPELESLVQRNFKNVFEK